MPEAASSQTVPPAREIARSGAARAAPKSGRRRDEHVVVAMHALAQALVVPLAGDVQDGRAGVAVGLDGEVVEAARACESAEEGDHRPVRRQIEATASLLLRDAAVVGRDRPPGDAVLGAVAAGDPVGEEDSARERRREPVREPEMRVRLRERGGELPPPGGVDHRPGDVAAAAEDDVRPALLEDRATRPGRTAGADQRPEQRRRRRAWKAGDLERVELVAGGRDEPSLDAIRRPGERHADAAVAQRLRHRERRQDVPGCSAGGDQGSQLARGRVHRQRC